MSDLTVNLLGGMDVVGPLASGAGLLVKDLGLEAGDLSLGGLAGRCIREPGSDDVIPGFLLIFLAGSSDDILMQEKKKKNWLI